MAKRKATEMAKQKSASERQELRLKILKVLYYEFNTTGDLPNEAIEVIYDSFPNENPKNILKELYYFREKNYLSFEEFHRTLNVIVPIKMKLQSSGIDLVEQDNIKSKKTLKKFLKNIVSLIRNSCLIKGLFAD